MRLLHACKYATFAERRAARRKKTQRESKSQARKNGLINTCVFNHIECGFLAFWWGYSFSESACG